MILYEKIQDILESKEYKKIPSNIPFVTLYVKYLDNNAKVIQLIDCEKEVKLTTAQFDVFCDKAHSFISEKGYENIELISIVVTSDISESRKFILGRNKCWIIDVRNPRILIFDNQPEDFDNLKSVIEDGISSYVTPQYQPSKATYGADRYSYNNESYSNKGGFRDEFTLVNTIMVFINIAVFIIMSFLGSTEDVDFVLNHGAMYVPAIIDDGQYYRFITCMFQHFGFMHLSGNMVVLLFLGDNVERAVGKIKYVAIYIIGGLIGSFGSFIYAYTYNKAIVSAGASGAIFALIGALLWLVIRNKGQLENMTTLRVCVLIAYALYNGFISQNVDMAAHIFGLIGGFFLAMLLYRYKE